jgi:hypothetical protein
MGVKQGLKISAASIELQMRLIEPLEDQQPTLISCCWRDVDTMCKKTDQDRT